MRKIVGRECKQCKSLIKYDVLFCSEECRQGYQKADRKKIRDAKALIKNLKPKLKKKGFHKTAAKYHRMSDEVFFKTPRWRKLRFRFIKKKGRVCMDCNAVLKRNAPGVEIHVVMIKPRSKKFKQATNFPNLKILCKDCLAADLKWKTIN